MVEISGKIIKGRRKYQQDNIFFESNCCASMSVVCDGMGGLEEGDWASHIAVQLMKKHFHKLKEFDNITQFYDKEIRYLDDVICKLENEKKKKIISGTTFSSAIIVDNRLYIGSVGDSRIYLYKKNENKLNILTRAHNYKLILDENKKKGIISNEEYMRELPKADSLVSYLGVGYLEYIDINNEPYILEDGDTVLVCSDGVYRSLNDIELCNIVRDNLYVEVLTDTVMDIIENKGYKSQDNAALVVMKYSQ